MEKKELRGGVDHREGREGDYDQFDDVESLIDFIKTGTLPGPKARN